MKNEEKSKIKRKPKGYWTKEKCLEDALKYKARTEWKKKSNSSYNSALKNGWSNECCKHMIEIIKPSGYWTKEKCTEDSLEYKTRAEWKKNSISSYGSALKNGWLDECCKHLIKIIKPSGYWTKGKCIESALKYKTRVEWKKNQVHHIICLVKIIGMKNVVNIWLKL